MSHPNPSTSSTTDSSHSNPSSTQQLDSSSSSTARTTRSQARRSSLPNPLPSTSTPSSSTSSSTRKRTRTQIEDEPESSTTAASSSSKAKGKKKQQQQEPQPSKRPRRSLPNPSTNIDASDPKGKKRALPSLSPEPDQQQQPSTTDSPKKKNSYTLRSSTTSTSTTSKNKGKGKAKMARKTRATAKKGGERVTKGNGGGVGGSGASRKQQHLEDVDMDDDDDLTLSDDDDEEDPTVDENRLSKASAPTGNGDPSGSRMDDGEDDDDDDNDEDDDDDEDPAPSRNGGANAGAGPGAGAIARALAREQQEDAAAAALFGSDYRQLGGYMSGLSSRLKAILSSIKSKNRTIQLSALQEASELLSVSTEDTLSGYFQVDAFVKEFVRIIAGRPSEPSPSLGGGGGEGSGARGAAAGGAAGAGAGGDEGEGANGGDGSDEDDGSEGGGGDDENEGDFVDVDDEEDEDAALARALAMSTQDAYPSGGGGVGGGGGGGGGQMVMMGEDPSADNLEAQLLACRCLYNLMEALPGSAHTVVHHGAVPILCSKLLEIQYIDLAEQTLSTMEKISQEYPDAIVREGGLSALLNFLDFFSTNVQRTAVTAAANCLRGVSKDSFNMVRDVFPMLRNVLGYPDQRLVEQGSLAVLRAIESFRHRADHLETLLDVQLIKALNQLLTPAGGSPVLTPGTYTHLLKALTTASKASPKVTLAFLEAGMVDTLYQILTGVFPGAHDSDEQGNGPDGQGLGGGLADMVVLHNLAHRPKDQVEEALALLSELMPPLPRDGVFDAKAYSEKSFNRLVRAKAKASRASSRQPSSTHLPIAAPTPQDSTDNLLSTSEATVAAPVPTPGGDAPSAEALSSSNAAAAVVPNPDDSAPSTSAAVVVDDPATAASKARSKEADLAAESRLTLLKSRPELTERFLKIIVPVLVDVYAASVALRVRTKVLTALLKTVSFLPSEELTKVLQNVPLASFLGSILSSRDNPALVHGALQLVELLLLKLPQVYRTSFRREGVMYEIDLLAEEELSTVKAKKTSAVVKIEEQDQQPIAGASTSSSSAAVPPPSSSSAPGAPPPPPGSASAALNRLALAQNLLSSSFGAPASAPSSPAKRPSAPVDPQDVNILRARVMKLKAVAEAGDSDGDDEAAKALENMRSLVTAMNDEDASIPVLREVVTKLAKLFGDETSSVSSFELLKSGLVDGLLECATTNGKASSSARRRLLFEVLSKEGPDGSKSPLAMLVKRLQESLSRMESFEVVTAFQGLPGEDSRRSSTALLARQLRLKLLADEGSDIPKFCSAMVVSIQAIATFQALNDYLRPKIAAPPPLPGGGMSSRLPGMYAAYAAAAGLSGGFPGGRSAAGSLAAALASASAAAGGPGRGGGGASIEDEEEDVKPAIPAAADDGNAAAGPSTGGGEASSSNATASGSKTEKLSRRRSARLNGKGTEEGAEAEAAGPSGSAASGGDEEASVAGSSAAGAGGEEGARATAGAVPSSSAELRGEAPRSGGVAPNEGDMDMGEDFDDDEGMYSDEFDDEMFDDDMEDALPPPPTEKTVDLSVAADGSKVEAKTPDGTRVGTPVQRPTSAAEGSSASPSRPPPGSSESGSRTSSYASALKAKPSDWHLEFSIAGHVLPLDTTIYGAIHQHESRSGATNGLQKGVWSGVYTINFRKVVGPAPPPSKEASPEPSTREPSSATALPNSVPSDSPQAKILRLLRVLHALNSEATELLTTPRPDTLAESAFVNNKLTAKLARQLEEPMILASACLPDWAMDLPRFFPFLFPFETRFAFLQSTSFGYARLIQKWQSQQAKSSDSRRDDSLGFLSRLQRQKVRISRSHLLESAVKVFELYGASTSILEVEYFEEVGTGLGPTLEFYSLASKEFGRRDLKLWRDADSNTPGLYVHRPQGLFPRPVDIEEVTAVGVVQTKIFKVLGQFVAKALMDSRIIDMSFSPVFLKLVLGHDVPLTMESLRGVDARLAKSLEKVAEFAEAKKGILTDLTLSDEDRTTAIADLTINGSRLIDFCLDFTLPGYDIELKEGGNELVVDSSNVEEYIEKVIDMTLVKGTAAQVKAFRSGFSTIFPVRDLLAFSPEELVILFGSAEEDWGADTLSEVLKADHGYNIESRSISNLIDIMSTYEAPVRREFLQFITGAPKLPIGGFRGLNPPLTVVRKGHEPPFKADDYLPSVMTCVNYLKLPDYTTRDVLAAKLLTAMREGGGSFHLS